MITDTLIQNQAVVVRYYKRNSKQKDLFCNYQYSIKQDDRFNHYKTKTPIKETETYFEFIDTVPENASTANITIYDLILQCILIIYTTWLF